MGGSLSGLVVRRETDKEQEVQVLYDEDLASRIAPEPCVVSREGQGEASAGAGAGWPSSHESGVLPGADRVTNLEGNTTRRGIASGGPARRGQRPQHAWTLLVREPRDLPSPPGGVACRRVASGRPDGRSR